MAKKRKNNNYVGSKGYNEREAARVELERKEKKRRIIIITAIVLIVTLLAATPFAIVGIVNEIKTGTLGTGHADDSLVSRDVSNNNVKYAEITVEKYGKFIVLLDATVAPKTVENFVKLANEGFYDGLTFHRANSTIIHGGDPDGTGSGGSSETIKGEFSANGYTNTISHKRGVISMARSGADRTDSSGNKISKYDTASSQFFICVEDYTGWNGQYAAFGYVVEGMSVVDAVNEAMLEKLDDGEDTIEKLSRQPVIRSVKILDDYTFVHQH